MLLGQQRQSLDIPRKVIDGSGGGENHGSSRGESEADEVVAGDFKAGLRIRGDLHDAAFSVLRRGDIEVGINVEGKSLRASQAAEEVRDRAVTVDPVHGIETRSSGSGDIQ